MRRFVFAVLASALACAHAVASPKEDLHEAFSKFLAAKSFRATVTDVKKGQQLSQMEYVAPDRYHMRTGDGPETIIIGDTGYMNVNGHRVQIPINVGRIVAQYRNEGLMSDVTVIDEQSGDLDGEPAHVYTYSTTKPAKTEAKVWVSEKSGLPLQIESQGSFMGVKSTTRVRYSDFDDPSIKVGQPGD
jgi:outer membrane lipoprotein-sorting protein